MPDEITVRRSIGHSHVLAPELRDQAKAKDVARRLTLKAASRLRRMEYYAATMSFAARLENDTRVHAEERVYRAQDNRTFLDLLNRLWTRALKPSPGTRIKKVSITLSDLVALTNLQAELFGSTTEADLAARGKAEKLSRAMDEINHRFGRDSVLIGMTPAQGNLSPAARSPSPVSRISMSFWSKASSTMPTVLQLDLGDIAADVVFKDIKNFNLRVCAPAGKVRISAPLRMSPDVIRRFALSKLDWIKHQQLKLRRYEREPSREYWDSESHYLWGKRYLLRLIEGSLAPSIHLTDDQIFLRLLPDTPIRKRQAIMEEWYRAWVTEAVPPLIAKWEAMMAVKVERFFVRRMTTRWGSCTPRTRRIRLNTELAKKSPELLEYVVVHEMVHLIVRHHNAQFTRLMDKHLPNWRYLRKALNHAPPPHTDCA